MDLTNAAEGMAHIFKSELPIFKEKAAGLSKNQLFRVLQAVVEAPLNEKPFLFYDKKEKEAFDSAMKLKGAQIGMTSAVLSQKDAAIKRGESSIHQGEIDEHLPDNVPKKE